MLYLLSVFIDTISTGAFAVPALLLLCAFLCKSSKPATKLLLTLLALYLAAAFSVTGMPTVTYHTIDVSVNLIPFVAMFASPSQTLLNVLLFVPLGCLAPLLWRCFFRPVNVMLLGLSTSLFIEVAQIFTLRATDVDDLITNTLGAVLGWLLLRLWLWMRKASLPAPTVLPVGCKLSFPLLLALCFAAMFFASPLLSTPLWSLVL